MIYTFANPYFSIFIAVVLSFGVFNLFFRKKSVSTMKTSLTPDLAKTSGFFANLGYFIPWLFRIIVLCLLVIALARPQEIKRSVYAHSSGVDIMICMDTSTSMQALDFEPFDRLEAAKNTAKDFISKRTDDRIGIVVFAANAMLVCPLTLDYRSILDFLGSVKIGMTYEDGTAIGDAIATSVNHLKDSVARSKVIILLTDGRNNTGEISNPVLAAQAAAQFAIKIYTIGTASKGLSKFPVDDPVFGTRYIYSQDELDEESLTKIADVTGAKFYRAQNYRELSDIYSEINALEKTEFEAPPTIDYTDKYGLFIFTALILLLLEFISKIFVFIRIP